MIHWIRRTLIAVVLTGAAAGCARNVDPRNEITGVAARFREFTVPTGTVLALRLDTSLASDTSRVDDPVKATLMEAVVVDGMDVLPRGSVLAGAVTAVEASGKLTGVASLAVQFRSVSVAGRSGEVYALSASLRTAGWASGLALSIPIDDDIDVKMPLKR